jgi:hypothetical protein
MHEMSFKHYQQTISTAITSQSDKKLNAFCHDVILRMLPYVQNADKSDLYPAEINIIEQLFVMAKSTDVNWQIAGQLLAEQTALDEADEDHAQEMDGDLIGFLCAMDNWQLFNATQNKSAVEGVSENMMNILDYYFADGALEDWLSVPEIATEYAAQMAFLNSD